MIGVYTKNNFLTQSIVELFKHLGATPWSSTQNYQAVILALPQKEVNAFFCQYPAIPAITLGAHHAKAYKSLSSPVHLEYIQNALLQLLNSTTTFARFENHAFIFDARTRQLFNKIRKKSIPLTEKENDLFAFLSNQPNHQATKDTIMHQVWRYSENTETHTLDSHIYALRQKIQDDSDDLFCYQNGILQLINLPD